MEGPADAPEKGFHRCAAEQESGLAVFYRFRQAAGLMADRQRAETLRVHLTEPEWLEARWNEGEVAAREDASRLAIVEADRHPDRIRIAAADVFQCPLQMF